MKKYKIQNRCQKNYHSCVPLTWYPYRDHSLRTSTLNTRMSVPSLKFSPPTPSPASECGSPSRTQVGVTHSLAVGGVGRPYFDDGTETELCFPE